ncbi:flagellar hook-basal body protein [Bacillus sp. CECT 9360]|uniref:flagellar hook-basal body protein n=1 Tax=Bacillus sp. CECT 9360 TaxID=2845821 RepID=UPI001E427C83|nr:flagellar hook-basal body protein [Bacillus sp. CECT 9360]CAH0345105.1 Flagellar basal-body rod protein FlgG [Bacillus sp. CECT 9360]
MNRTMITATNTLGQLQHKMDMISNNISNIDTNGFKRKESYFNDLLVQAFNNQRQENETGRLTPLGIRQGTGARISQSQLVLTQGNIKNTERNLDVALEREDLFFRVRVADNNGENVRFTRDGAFYLTPVSNNPEQMMLVTGKGYPVLDENDAPIVINGRANNLTFSKEGQLQVQTDNNGTQTFNLGIVSVKKPQFLEQIGENLLGMPANIDQLGIEEEDIMTALNGGLRDDISLRQGALESSNVDLSKEMTDLMNVQRQYQFNSRSVTMADQMLGLINGIR